MSKSKFGRLVLVRHGQSIWNVDDVTRGLVTRFTGWADVELTDRGISQAIAAGQCLKHYNIVPDIVFTSLLQRSKKTYDEMAKDIENRSTPVISSWRLNERHYGKLVGLSKQQASETMNTQHLIEWRRSWTAAPPPVSNAELSRFGNTECSSPLTIISEQGTRSVRVVEKGIVLPETESLKDCAERVIPIWTNGIVPRLLKGETVLVVAHANSIRAIVKSVDCISDANIRDIFIPSATPLLYKFLIPDAAASPSSSSSKQQGARLQPHGNPTALGMTGRYMTTPALLQLLPRFKDTANQQAWLDSEFSAMKAAHAIEEVGDGSDNHSCLDDGHVDASHV